MNTPNFTVSFGKSRINHYTPHQIKIMREIKKAAIENNWCDIYTGDTFSKANPPTIEHFIAHALRKSTKVQQLSKDGFQIDGLDNIFPVGSLGNSTRSKDKFAKIISEDSKILDRLLIEFDKYRQYKSELINGEIWIEKLKKTALQELSGLCSDLDTKALKILI